jgi:hypothetical protein
VMTCRCSHANMRIWIRRGTVDWSDTIWVFANTGLVQRVAADIRRRRGWNTAPESNRLCHDEGWASAVAFTK